mgnify:CR=1 FL=1
MQMLSFNPSVGILFIQADAQSRPFRPSGRFQSLGRDSVHSSVDRERQGNTVLEFQSLGRDSVHSSLKTRIKKLGIAGFNPSVGILFIQAERQDSPVLYQGEVSIPRSGFCSFKLDCLGGH